jgi:protein-disulfide isomerase
MFVLVLFRFFNAREREYDANGLRRYPPVRGLNVFFELLKCGIEQRQQTPTRHAADVFPFLKDRFISTGKIRYGTMNLPLDNHPAAKYLAVAALCARAQGRYWEMHNRLSGSSKIILDSQFARLLDGIELDSTKFQHCMREDEGPRKQIERELGIAQNLGLSATPTFAIGYIGVDNRLKVTKLVVGAQPFEVFVRVIEELLQKEL